MSDPFLGEIRIFAGKFAPKGWAFCNGQLLNISEHTALFRLLGNVYGGDGETNFALPDFQGRVPVHQGEGHGLTPRHPGDHGGEAFTVLSQEQMPAHQHLLQCSSDAGTSKNPQNSVLAKTPGFKGRPGKSAYTPYSMDKAVTMSNSALFPVGESQPHNNMQPYLALNFIIALKGELPSRP